MLGRNVPARVRQRPVEMGVAADVEPPAFHLNPERTAVGQAVHILDGEPKRH